MALLAVPAPAHAGSYDVVSCGAPGAGGVNKAWRGAPGFDARFYDVAASCPELSAWSERRPGVTAPYFTGAGFELLAPAGTVLDRMVIWRTGYRFNNTGTGQGPWTVQGVSRRRLGDRGPVHRRDVPDPRAAGLPLRRRGRDGP